jgi:hypothetical protein
LISRVGIEAICNSAVHFDVFKTYLKNNSGIESRHDLEAYLYPGPFRTVTSRDAGLETTWTMHMDVRVPWRQDAWNGCIHGVF